MNILITGSNGFVGSKLMFLLEERGHYVLGIDRAIDTPNPKHTSTIIGDLNDPETLKKVEGDFELIVHCAAAKTDFGVSKAEYYKDNLEATERLMEYAISQGIRKVIYFSTVSVYGHQDDSMDETATFESNTVYGDSKLAGERALEKWLELDEENKAIVLRPSVIYGPNNYANMYNLLDTMYRRSFLMIGKGDHVKSMVALTNIADMTLFVINRGFNEKLEAFNCIDKPYLTVTELMKYISEEEGFKIPKIKIPMWLAYLLATPFELLSKITSKDLKVNWNRLKKFSTSTDYRADKIRDAGYVQAYSTKDEIQAMARWYKSLKND